MPVVGISAQDEGEHPVGRLWKNRAEPGMAELERHREVPQERVLEKPPHRMLWLGGECCSGSVGFKQRPVTAQSQ
ncbi:hypothetical protein GCM10008110_01020 [Marinobacter persicus]|nr:hypothetical protein GCM10008110_01020 [Marinobacter persicus]